MKSIILLTITVVVVCISAASQNLILNGSFEDNTAKGNVLNLTSAWSSTVSNSFEVGVGSMDLITSNTCGMASDGNWFVTCSPQSGVWPYMAFSFKLNTILDFGTQYTLTFDKRYCGPNTSAIDIGVSNDSTLIGTSIHTFAWPLINTWATESYVFQAPLAGNYLTVKVGSTGGTGTVGLDNFSLQEVVSGMNELTNENLQVFPNPSKGLLTISMPSTINKKEVEIYDVMGELVDAPNFKHQTSNEIDLFNAPKGIYFLKIYDEQSFIIKRIVIQ